MDFDKAALQSVGEAIRKAAGENFAGGRRSGTLQSAVQNADVTTETTADGFQVTVTLADKMRPSRGRERVGVSTRFYGPIVFEVPRNLRGSGVGANPFVLTPGQEQAATDAATAAVVEAVNRRLEQMG